MYYSSMMCQYLNGHIKRLNVIHAQLLIVELLSLYAYLKSSQLLIVELLSIVGAYDRRFGADKLLM